MTRPRNRDNFQRRSTHLVLRLSPIVALLIVGCAAPPPAYTVKSSDPTSKIPAIRIAVKNGDQSVVPELVKDLESDDPAVRFYADNGLKKLTGQDFGFHYYADDNSRKSAVQRWQAWLAGSHQPSTARADSNAQNHDGPPSDRPGGSADPASPAIAPSTQDGR